MRPLLVVQFMPGQKWAGKEGKEEKAPAALRQKNSNPSLDCCELANGDAYGIRTRECMRERHVS